MNRSKSKNNNVYSQKSIESKAFSSMFEPTGQIDLLKRLIQCQTNFTYLCILLLLLRTSTAHAEMSVFSIQTRIASTGKQAK